MDRAESLKIYRRALGAFATGVVVIVAEDEVGALGVTVNSFTSVSLDPPLILWCIDNRSDRRHLFGNAERFVVNVLGADDREHSDRFAFGAYRMEPHELERSAGGAAMLTGALTRLVCETREKIQLGDHLVIVGEVTAFDSRDGDALLYFRGRYGRALAEEPAQ